MTNGQAPPPKPPGPLPRRVPGSSRLMPGQRPEVPRPRLMGGPAAAAAGVRAPEEQSARPELRPVPPQAPATGIPFREGQALGTDAPSREGQAAETGAPSPEGQAARPEVRPQNGRQVGTEARPPQEQAPRPEVPRPGPANGQAPGPEPDRPRLDGPPAGAAEEPVPPPDERVTGPVVLRRDAQVERQDAGGLAPRAAAEVTPSWPQVVGTTVQLWVARRRTWWRVLAVLIVVLVVFAAGGLTVALLRGTRPGHAAGGDRAASGSPGLAQVQAAAAARQQAATWVTAQVSHSAMVSCDPAMCAVLEARGFPSGDLLMLGSAASDPLGSAVIVATAAVRSEFGSRLTSVYAPTVIATFGSGSARIDVRAYAAGGAAVYLAALRADQAVRQNLGGVLLRNSRISAAPAARAQLAAGQVDTRLLTILATLTHQGTVSIVAFGDSGPGADPGVPLRAVELASPPGAKSGYLSSVLALLRAQQAPYLPNTATLARLAGGQEIARIEFAAPSPLGLLSG
jgi:hypothetical protein